MLPNKLELALSILNINDDIALVCSDFQPFDDSPKKHTSWLKQAHVKELIDSIPQVMLSKYCYAFSRPIYPEILKHNFIGTSTVVMRRDAVLQTGLFDTNLAGAEDRDVWMKLAKLGFRFAYIDQVLSKYRLSSNSLSHSMRFLESQVRYYRRQLLDEKDPENKKIMCDRIATRAFEYGLRLKDENKFRQSLYYQWQAICFGNLRRKSICLFSIAKLPLFLLIYLIKG